MSCQNIRFGFDNLVPHSSIISSPTPTVTHDNLKNTKAGRPAVWGELTTAPVIIVGTFSEDVTAEFIALPGSDIPAGATVLFQLYDTDIFTGNELLNADPITVSGQVPLGIWQAGINPYGTTDELYSAPSIAKWFDQPITFRTYRIVIEHGYSAPTVSTSTTLAQDVVTGIVSMESDYGVPGNADGSNAWITTTDASATNGSYAQRSGSTDYSNDQESAPTLTFDFQCTVTGQIDLYIKGRSGGSGNLHYVTLNGGTNIRYVAPTTDLEWGKLYSPHLVAGQTYTLEFAPRNGIFDIDKVVAVPFGDPAPTGDGPAVSSAGTDSDSGSVAIRMVYIGRKLFMDKNFSFGNSLRLLTDPEITKSGSGRALQGKAQKKAREISLTLAQMSDADKIGLAMMETALLGYPFIVSVRPGSSEWNENTHTMLANFAQALDYTQILNATHQVPIKLLEV